MKNTISIIPFLFLVSVVVIPANSLAAEREFIIHIDNSGGHVVSVRAQLHAGTSGCGYDMQNHTIFVIHSFSDVSTAGWDSPKAVDYTNVKYLPWALIDFTVLVDNESNFTFTIDFRDVRWSDQQFYPGADTHFHINIDAHQYYLIPGNLGTHWDLRPTQNIWQVWGWDEYDNVLPEAGSLMSLHLSNLLYDNNNTNPGGTLYVDQNPVTSGGSFPIDEGSTHAIRTNDERFPHFLGGSTWKHHDWNFTNLYTINRGSVSLPFNLTTQNAIYERLSEGYALAGLVDGGSAVGSCVEFQDPWYLNANNQQLTNEWIALPSSGLPPGAYYNQSTGGVFHSSDNGVSWTDVNSGLTNLNVNSLAFNSVNLFAGTDGGVFLSTNNGSSWGTTSFGSSYSYVRSLAFSKNYVFAGTGFIGVWRHAL